jgi:hypothetical protein
MSHPLLEFETLRSGPLEWDSLDMIFQVIGNANTPFCGILGSLEFLIKSLSFFGGFGSTVQVQTEADLKDEGKTASSAIWQARYDHSKQSSDISRAARYFQLKNPPPPRTKRS